MQLNHFLNFIQGPDGRMLLFLPKKVFKSIYISIGYHPGSIAAEHVVSNASQIVTSGTHIGCMQYKILLNMILSLCMSDLVLSCYLAWGGHK